MPLTTEESYAGFATLRRFLDDSGFGYHFNDPAVQRASDAVVEAVALHRKGVEDVPPPETEEPPPETEEPPPEELSLSRSS